VIIAFTLQAIRHGRHCNIIHAHWPIAGLAGLIAGRLLGKPVVMTLHHGSIRNMGRIERFVTEQVDQVLCNSSFTLSNILKDAKPKIYKVLPPGIDIHQFGPMPKEKTRVDLLPAIPRERPLIFTLGRLIELKGHRYLINALSLLQKEPKPHLIIGGDGPLRESLEAQAHDKGVADRVTFLGTLPYQSTPKWYSAADIYVQPSLVDRDGNTEGLGMTVMEALACGTPCVGTNVGGIPDVVKDGLNGFLVKPADPSDLSDKINTLLTDEVLRKRLGTQGMHMMQDTFSWENKAMELAEIYNSLLMK
jgi:glycosyltransferase involved in cell wall biosynthesis